MPHTYSPPALDACQLLGLHIAQQRRKRQWTSAALAERAGISRVTLRNIENGAPTVKLGTVFEVATLVGVPLFNVERNELARLTHQATNELQLLPGRIQEPDKDVDDNF